jgi:hypothetical protein
VPATDVDAALVAARAATSAPRSSSITVTGLPESNHLSEQLRRAARAAGVETPVGRRLLRLRDELDSHVLAASVLEESGARNARHLLRRGVDAVAADLAQVR